MRRILPTIAAAVLATTLFPFAASAQNNTKAQPANAGVVANPPPKIDAAAVESALAELRQKQYVDAEKHLRAVVAAIDADPSSANPLRHRLRECLAALARVEHTLGQNQNALKTSLRYHNLISSLLANDPTRRDPLLDQNAIELTDIYVALDRADEAEALLKSRLEAAEKNVAGNPMRVLDLRVKWAQLADAQDHDKEARIRWQSVVTLAAQAAKGINRQPLPDDDFVRCAQSLAKGYLACNQISRAIETYTLLSKFQSNQLRDPQATLETQIVIASYRAKLGQYNEAQKQFQEIIALSDLLAKSGREAEVHALLASVYEALGAQSEARKQWELAAAIDADQLRHLRKLPERGGQEMDLLNSMQIALRKSQRFDAAMVACRELLELRQKTFGEQHPLTIAAKADLGALFGQMESYKSALPLLQSAYDYWFHHNPPAPLQLARALNDLAVVERGVGSFNDAKDHLEQALKLRQEHLDPNDMRVAQSCVNLASVLLDQANYAQSIVLLEQAVEIYRQIGESAQESLSRALLNEARVYRSQGLFDKAAQYCNQSLAVLQKCVGTDSPATIDHYNTLTSLCIARGKIDDAAKFANQAWTLCQKNQLENDPIAGDVLYQKARVEYKQNKLAEAKRDWQAALNIERAAGQTALAARTLNYLADAASVGDATTAERMYRQALAMQGAAQAHPEAYFITSCRLAEILYGKAKPSEAIDLVQNAVKTIEAPRANTIGGEAERAEFFAQFAAAFDLLVNWNLAQGNVDKAFEFAEQGRNRTFRDQLSLVGIDLRDTLGPGGEKLRDKERALRTEFATLQAEARTAGQSAAAAPLIENLKKIQLEYAQVLAEIHNASPYYRERLSHEGKLSSLEALRLQLKQLNSVMLFYYAGAKQTYLLVIDPESAKTKVVRLEIPAGLAGAMKVKSGPITRASLVQLVSQYLADIRDHDGGRGLAGTVNSEKGVQAADQGTALAEVLVPRDVRTTVENRKTQGTAQCVIIVPDGALDELPFESLLINRKPATYLLDVFPPVAYAPSANILVNLIDRPTAKDNTVTVLTLGNPTYPQGHVAASVQRSIADATRAAYLGLGGSLPPLPATEKECRQIATSFQKHNIPVLELDAEHATEKNFRADLPGRRFIHVAAHGLVDQQNENLFGAIALTPPAKPTGSTEDDGFLSVNEIFNLPLSGCELVALSACQTNVGPDRPLEAGSTIAQAFLAAGARRAVCSHWNVNDESTAELMGSFFEQIAKAARPAAGAGMASIDYAKALHEAQLTVRNDARFSSPYYWAPFVLIGPPQ